MFEKNFLGAGFIKIKQEIIFNVLKIIVKSEEKIAYPKDGC